MKNFRKILDDIDPVPLLRQIYANPQLWNSDNLWTDPTRGTVLSALENIVLRHRKAATPFNPNMNKWPFTVLSEAQPIVRRLREAVDCELLGNVMISRMQPGEIIPPHADISMIEGGPSLFPFKVVDRNAPPQRTPVPPVHSRYQIPLYGRPGVDFICGDEHLFMEPGTAWCFNNQITHSVENNSSEVRISMIVEIRSFEAIPA